MIGHSGFNTFHVTVNFTTPASSNLVNFVLTVGTTFSMSQWIHNHQSVDFTIGVRYGHYNHLKGM